MSVEDTPRDVIAEHLFELEKRRLEAAKEIEENAARFREEQRKLYEEADDKAVNVTIEGKMQMHGKAHAMRLRSQSNPNLTMHSSPNAHNNEREGEIDYDLHLLNLPQHRQFPL
ncbi:MAG: hypothetical protein ACRDDA_05220, partial [Aeromonas sp.]